MGTRKGSVVIVASGPPPHPPDITAPPNIPGHCASLEKLRFSAHIPLASGGGVSSDSEFTLLTSDFHSTRKFHGSAWGRHYLQKLLT